MKIIMILSVFFLCLSSKNIYAASFLLDGFESGNLTNPVISGSSGWGGTSAGSGDSVSVSTEQAHSGSHSLRFNFAGNASTSDDAWAEQRANITQTNEFWGRMYVYIPQNYYHRNVSPNNNKFWAIYASPYETPGFQINLSTYAKTDGTSGLSLHTYHNGVEQRQLLPYSNFISAGDFGKWMEVIVRVKVPANSTSADGVIQVWKNGTQIANYTSLNIYGSNGRNYINQVYLLGWSNSGFNQTTVMYVDDVTLGSDLIAPASVPPIAAPAPGGLQITTPK